MDYTIWPIVAGDDEHLEVVVDRFEPPMVFDTWKFQIREGDDVESDLWTEATCVQTVNGAGYMTVDVTLTAAQTRLISQRMKARCCVGYFGLQFVDENGETHTPLKGEIDMILDVTL